MALSTLPAVWSGVGDAGIARSLAETLLNTLGLELIYVQLGEGKDTVAVVRGKSHDPRHDEEAITVLAALLHDHRGKLSATIPHPFGLGTLRVAVVRFGIGSDHGALIACSVTADFPTEQDRLLLGVAANQAANVLQRSHVQEQAHEQKEWLRVTLASIGDAVIATDLDGRVSFMNPTAQALTGWDLQQAQGQALSSVFNIVDEQTRQPFESPADTLRRVKAPLGVGAQAMLIAKNGAEYPIDNSVAPIQDSAGQMIGVVVVFRTVQEQRRREHLRNARLGVTQALNESATVQDAAIRALRAVCQELGWDAGLFWFLTDDGEHLECRTYWHGQDMARTPLTIASCERLFASGEGLPGRVHTTGQPAWIPDLLLDRDFPRHTIASQLGLRSAFACPVIVGQRRLGVIEFFSRSLREPDADLLEMMGTLAANLGQFVERKVAEEELRQSEEELAEFFENASVGLHWVGEDGTILRANRAELDMLGYSREEYVSRSITEFHADQEAICDILNRLKAGEKLLEYPARLRCKDGSIKHVLIDSSVMWNDGRFIHTRCFTRDVTERWRAETALADTRSRLDAALVAGAIATWSWDIPNNRVYGDGELERLFNLPPSEGAGGRLDSFLKAIHPADVSEMQTKLNRSVDTGEPYEADYRIVQADGSIRWVTARGLLERDEAGRPLRMPGVLVDITERKRLETELQLRVNQQAEAYRQRDDLMNSLRESEQKLRLLANSIPQLAWMAHPDGAIFWYNQRWYDYTGTTLEQMAGWGWQAVHDPEMLPRVIERWKASILSGEPFDMVFPLRGTDGRLRPFLTRVSPLRSEHGQILYWFGTNTDISDIKRMEEALRDADRRKDEFLATLAHELRNPLAPLRNSLQILKMPHVDTPVIKQSAAIMERQVDHLVRLVDDLMDVSRVMRGKIELRKELMELATVVARAVETANPVIAGQRHRLELSLPQESLLVEVDPVRMIQVIGNLLTNAAKYTKASGHIKVFARHEPGEVNLHIQDDGIGIAPDVLPRVFDLFVQADHTSTRAQGGLGIGLTLARHLTRMHGGAIEARSAGLGRGSEFILRLPLISQPMPGSSSDEANPVLEHNSPSGRRVLVVDDNQDAALSLATLLRLRGHEVRVTHDGPAALELVSSYLPEIIFLDIGMPGMDGYEVARRLRGQPRFQGVVLAALTGWGQEDDRRRTAEAGFDHHLVKPLNMNVLSKLLESAS